jgi:hypothetical protein
MKRFTIQYIRDAVDKKNWEFELKAMVEEYVNYCERNGYRRPTDEQILDEVNMITDNFTEQTYKKAFNFNTQNLKDGYRYQERLMWVVQNLDSSTRN